MRTLTTALRTALETMPETALVRTLTTALVLTMDMMTGPTRPTGAWPSPAGPRRSSSSAGSPQSGARIPPRHTLPAPPSSNGPLVNNALLCLDVGGAVLDAPWRRLRPTGAPPDARFRHSATLAGTALDPTMAVWGGFTVRPQVDEPQVDEPDDLDTPIQTPWDQCCSNELYLLHVGDLRWSSPALRGPLPSPRGGHSATLIGATLVIVGGCDGGEQGVPRDDELFLERDLSNVVLLDLARLTYVATEPVVCSFEPRSGHCAVLVPCDGGLGLLVLGGRDYRPPQFPWDEGEHHGRALVDRLALTLKP